MYRYDPSEQPPVAIVTVQVTDPATGKNRQYGSTRRSSRCTSRSFCHSGGFSSLTLPPGVSHEALARLLEDARTREAILQAMVRRFEQRYGGIEIEL